LSRIAVIGTGYVGLAAGACFARLGHNVLCADIDEEKIAALARGDVPILEAGLPELVQEGLAARRLKFVVGGAAAAASCEFAYLCVPTPQAADGSANLSFVRQAATEIGPVLPPHSVVVNKSTVPIDSTRLVADALGRSDVAVVSNPEFLREGSAVYDFLHPDRIVIGADDQRAAARVAELYRNVDAPVIVTDPASAEMIKYASNAFLATKLSFVNALANVCEAVGADARDVLLGMGYDHRIGFDYLRPGPGWGGSCFPKDVTALLRIAQGAGYEFRLLQGVAEVNCEQFDRLADKVAAMAGGSLEGATVAVWGLTFKAGTDDLRESPALAVIDRLRRQGARVQAYDPAVTGALDGIDVCADPYGACEGAAVLVVLTEWDEFRRLDFTKVAGLLEAPRVVDGRNLLDPVALRRQGYAYAGLGR
jgi:UDPglucose 6-dehydrogenase